jgi:superfamily II DNA or RNA helicase
MSNQQYQPGSMVRLRGREWIVMPSQDSDLLIVKPLGGTEAEITGIYLPLRFRSDLVRSAELSIPGMDDLGDIESARLLYDASRLAFRHASGPFRSIGKYSFRPRAYQMVPLIMALKQEDPVRLLIADDVGIGKTIEALMIAKEMVERGVIHRFAVVCLPHLCEQWQKELQDKFGIEAVIVRTSTANTLERKIYGDGSIFRNYDYQVISIDYIKAPDERRNTFVQEAPELVIVDEAHTCARPSGASVSQQQRHRLLNEIAKRKNQHLILLTATPHSGKVEEFQSLLGLLNGSFENIDLATADQPTRKKVAGHFVQRRRRDVEKWSKESTKFPERIATEEEYLLSPEYSNVFVHALNFARELITHDEENTKRRRMSYWTALALLRGIMSSPRMGMTMLQNRARKQLSEEDIDSFYPFNPVADSDFGGDSDSAPVDLIGHVDVPDNTWKSLRKLAEEVEALNDVKKDHKLAKLIGLVKDWVKDGFHPIIFCRYISTAEYVGEKLKEVFQSKHNTVVQTVTSSVPDEARKEIVDRTGKFANRILIATDCMSEGINLQEFYTGVIHYDLPWNPNRLEQREGRVDRFGQSADKVRVALLFGKNNPIDGAVLKVLLRKAMQIKKSIGISVPFPGSNESVMEAVTNAILLNPKYTQLQLSFEFAELNSWEEQVDGEYEKVSRQLEATRHIFAQHAIKAQDIEQDLAEVDEMIGNMDCVETFFTTAIRRLGGQIDKQKKGYRLYRQNLPAALEEHFDDGTTMDVSFLSPTPEGFRYLGRNHAMVETLCQVIVNNAFLQADDINRIARACVIRTETVTERTTIVELRMRNVISHKASGNEIVSEEMFLWGYHGLPQDRRWLDQMECQTLLQSEPIGETSETERKEFLTDVEDDLRGAQAMLKELALARAYHLAASHERYRIAVGGASYQAVQPVIPPDILGIFILIPTRKSS